ncbi:MAG: hypothetical protein A3F12_04200 [Gammaproteobacteria bacterium RIFCSPHIGHO2_12_FULL_38_14]|nr:MAG: hypothetical protein A3F12_04200 [Gammaproteobacteria bacterium RIFCSPHIGHO2_12_FULL_38_14]
MEQESVKIVRDKDEQQGLIKIYWEEAREYVQQVEPTFAGIVDELEPDHSFPLYLAYYPYGAYDADTQSSLLPDGKGGYYRISDPNAPKDIIKYLGYSKDYTPLGMVLEKEIECFIDLKNEGITIPRWVYKPGKIFPFSRFLGKKTNRIYSPNDLLSSTAGARSAFMLPNIGCSINHANLQRDFNVQSSTPKSMYEHWSIFKEILQSEAIKDEWRCCVMYFSENWITKIRGDIAWTSLNKYLYEIAWNQFEYERNRIYYEIILSVIQKKRNLKPNPYLADTARHLFATTLGAAPGYAPATNENALPLNIIQKAFIESYGLKKYYPTVMYPTHFNFEEDTTPIYYSLQHPSTHVFSPKSRNDSTTLYDMRELQRIMRIFIEELTKETSISSDTIFNEVAKEMNLKYFHNKKCQHHIVQPSADLVSLDERFQYVTPNNKANGAKFASDAPFVRGCISISRNV